MPDEEKKDKRQQSPQESAGTPEEAAETKVDPGGDDDGPGGGQRQPDPVEGEPEESGPPDELEPAAGSVGVTPMQQRETLARAIEALDSTGDMGTLILHYPQRDVEVILDGASAMRVLTMLVKRRELGLADHMSPSASPDRAWLVFDLKEPLACSWIPGTPRPARRTAIDPVWPPPFGTGARPQAAA